jgi:hypothetical protein
MYITRQQIILQFHSYRGTPIPIEVKILNNVFFICYVIDVSDVLAVKVL